MKRTCTILVQWNLLDVCFVVVVFVVFFWGGGKNTQTCIVLKNKIYCKSENNYKTVHYLQRQRHRHKQEPYNKVREKRKRIVTTYKF